MPNLTATQAAEALKPCPFCGGTTFRIDDENIFYVKSVKCLGCFLDYSHHKWNTRAPDPQVQVLQLELAEAEGALQHSLKCDMETHKDRQVVLLALETIAKVKG